jgi:hypothetical protein
MVSSHQSYRNCSGARIDYILATKDLIDSMTGADIDAAIIGSDHCPVWATFNLTTDDRMPPQQQPPRLCARYLPHLRPSQSIRSLFMNIPGHIVLRSNEEPLTRNVGASIGKGTKRSHAVAFAADDLVRANSNSPQSNTRLSQRSICDFVKLSPTPSTSSTPIILEGRPASDSLQSIAVNSRVGVKLTRPDRESAPPEQTSIRYNTTTVGVNIHKEATATL